jgi:MazG family protein
VAGGGVGLAEAVLALQELAERLRRDCPWDREQTERTIVPHTVEEAYEVADAAVVGDDAKLRDELGDLLFQVVFLSLLLEERGAGDLAAVARNLHGKLVRRHPHVFGDAAAETAGEVKDRWEALKTTQEAREGIFHDIPSNLPALVLARKVARRAATVGFDYPEAQGALEDVEDELRELREAMDGAPDARAETEPDPRVFDELGDVLYAVSNLARKLNVDAELALRASVARFRDRVETAERLAAGEGRDFAALPLDEQDRYFDRAKEREQA